MTKSKTCRAHFEVRVRRWTAAQDVSDVWACQSAAAAATLTQTNSALDPTHRNRRRSARRGPGTGPETGLHSTDEQRDVDHGVVDIDIVNCGQQGGIGACKR